MFRFAQWRRQVPNRCSHNTTRKPGIRCRPYLANLEARLVPVSPSFAGGALEITRTAPGAAMTWVDPSRVTTNLVAPNDRLEATVDVTFGFSAAERTSITAPGGLNVTQRIWFMEDDIFFN